MISLNIAPPDDPRLPYPTLSRVGPGGRCQVISEEYVIPPGDKDQVVQRLWLYAEPITMTTLMIDIECDRQFRAEDFKIVREGGQNHLVSPYYYESGATIIDCWPA
jgi:hypothetical protein